ncbi:MAG: hypothetical protein JXQ83_09965 [Candidatus Glassbacteria bacterium]|nr:hypothetical protein [Candidatus Glassbacteria bacterium]
MAPEMQKIFLTVPFVIILIVMFIWLVKALLPGASQKAAQLRLDEFDRAGYETMGEMRRKEVGVMALGGLVILICLVCAGALGYYALVSAAEGDTTSGRSFELVLVFIPAIVLLCLVVTASRRYVQVQQQTLKEYRGFQSKRKKALEEYQEKRKGKKKAEEKKAAPHARGRQSQKPDRYKKRRPKLR